MKTPSEEGVLRLRFQKKSMTFLRFHRANRFHLGLPVWYYWDKCQRCQTDI